MTTTQTLISAPAGMPHMSVRREFAAPRDLVFRAHTDPDLLVQWLGPRELTTTIEHFEPRHGGTWHYTSHDAEGNAYAFQGVFHGNPSPDGYIQTFEYEGMPGHVVLETTTFTEQLGRTLVQVNSVFQSVEDRDGMIESGAEIGINEGYERLDELVARLA